MIILHHSADTSTSPQYEKIAAYHDSGAGGKWPKGHGIQYAWVVGMNGTVREGKPENVVTWHSGNWLLNQVSIGVVLCGDFTKNKPGAAQIESLERLLTGIQERWEIPDEAILLHRECRATSCPGVDLRQLVQLRRKAMKITAKIPASSSSIIQRGLARGLARVVRWMAS